MHEDLVQRFTLVMVYNYNGRNVHGRSPLVNSKIANDNDTTPFNVAPLTVTVLLHRSCQYIIRLKITFTNLEQRK